MTKENQNTTHVGLADVFSIDANVKSRRGLATVIKALGDPNNPLVEIWADDASPIVKGLKVGSQIGYLAQKKMEPSDADPRKLIEKTYFSYIPVTNVKRFLGEGGSNV